MFRHPSHRQLKNRSLKRRVSSHHFIAKHEGNKANDYRQQRANQSALNKLKRQPELIDNIWKNLKEKQQQNPLQPQLIQWHNLLNLVKQRDMTIDDLSELIMDYTEEAALLRKYSVLDCLFNKIVNN
jgi:hypothetical protein